MSGQERPNTGSDRRRAGGGGPPVRIVRDLHSDLSLRLTEVGEHTRVAVLGEVDHGCADTLRQVLCAGLRHSARGLLVDLGGVAFCDCAGLNALLHARRLAGELGRDLAVTAVSPAMERLLTLTATRGLFLPAYTSSPGSDRPPGPACRPAVSHRRSVAHHRGRLPGVPAAATGARPRRAPR